MYALLSQRPVRKHSIRHTRSALVGSRVSFHRRERVDSLGVSGVGLASRSGAAGDCWADFSMAGPVPTERRYGGIEGDVTTTERDEREEEGQGILPEEVGMVIEKRREKNSPGKKCLWHDKNRVWAILSKLARLAQPFWGQFQSDSNWAGAADLREACEVEFRRFFFSTLPLLAQPLPIVRGSVGLSCQANRLSTTERTNEYRLFWKSHDSGLTPRDCVN